MGNLSSEYHAGLLRRLNTVLRGGGVFVKQDSLCLTTPTKGISMKKTTLVVVLALVLTFAFASSAFATTGKFYAGGVDYYKWLRTTGNPAPGTAFINDGTSLL